jgi:hypothetical protein
MVGGALVGRAVVGGALVGETVVGGALEGGVLEAGELEGEDGATDGVTTTTGGEARYCGGPPAAACQAANVAGPVELACAGPYVKVTGEPDTRLSAGAPTGPRAVQPLGTVTPTDPLGLAPQLPAV